jgi:alanine dehydrogenase
MEKDNMKIGIPRERKLLEGRIALTPQAVAVLVQQGHQVIVEVNAGLKSGYSNQDYLAAGAKIGSDLPTIYAADLVVKVKEPVQEEIKHLRKDQILFCYLHLAAYPDVLAGLLRQQVTALAYETLTQDGYLPLLAPMSAIAGRLSVQLGIQYLQQNNNGAGVLLGGVMNTHKGRVVILGAGVAGSHAALFAAVLGADVYVFDKSDQALAKLVEQCPAIHVAIFSEQALAVLLPQTDLLIGAVLIKGDHAPKLFTNALQQQLPKGRIMVDIAIDQGGCIEGIHATDWQQPIYWQDGRGYIAVTNMPGAVPRTSTQALSQVILPYVAEIAAGKLETNAILQTAIAVKEGKPIHLALIN